MKGLGLPPIKVTDEETGEWIEIKAKLTRGDQEKYANTIMELTQDGRMDVRTVDWLTPILELAVVGWDLKTEDGQPWGAFARERVKELPHDSDLMEKVQAAIAAENPTFGSKAFLTMRVVNGPPAAPSGSEG